MLFKSWPAFNLSTIINKNMYKCFRKQCTNFSMIQASIFTWNLAILKNFQNVDPLINLETTISALSWPTSKCWLHTSLIHERKYQWEKTFTSCVLSRVSSVNMFEKVDWYLSMIHLGQFYHSLKQIKQIKGKFHQNICSTVSC